MKYVAMCCSAILLPPTIKQKFVLGREVRTALEVILQFLLLITVGQAVGQANQRSNKVRLWVVTSHQWSWERLFF